MRKDAFGIKIYDYLGSLSSVGHTEQVQNNIKDGITKKVNDRKFQWILVCPLEGPYDVFVDWEFFFYVHGFVENKFIQFKTNSIPVCTNDQATISGEDNTIFNIYLKKG